MINLRADIRISIRWTIIRIQVTEAGFSAIIRVTTWMELSTCGNLHDILYVH